MSAVRQFAEFVASSEVPHAARAVARDAFQDTVGVMLAGAIEPAARLVQRVTRAESADGPSSILATRQRAGASWAALANGTAAHALDFDDMCWVTLAHPSTPLVAAALAVGETVGATGRRLLDAYAAGFEVEAVLGAAMNPSHYEHGWHGTATIGTIGAAATAARVRGLSTNATARALAIAASEASGVKENFGTMVKPLQAGFAARNGVLAASLAAEGFTASEKAIDGPQGLLLAMRSGALDLAGPMRSLGHRWEIVDGGITFKLYPSCAATHPTIDTLLDLRRAHGVEPSMVIAIEIDVDPVVPTVLIHDRPVTGLEGKFSLHFCAAAALAHGRVAIDTFEPEAFADPALQRLVPLVTMRIDETLGREAPPLTQARIRVMLADGVTLERSVTGARGYPERPPERGELDAKFTTCATRAVSAEAARVALASLGGLEELANVRDLTRVLTAVETSEPAMSGT